MELYKIYEKLQYGPLMESIILLEDYLLRKAEIKLQQVHSNEILRQKALYQQIKNDNLSTADPLLYSEICSEIKIELTSLIFKLNGKPIQKITKILFISSDPIDADALQTGKELSDIQNAIQAATYRDAFELIPSTYGLWTEISNDIASHRPEIIHFSGHSSDTGIQLVNEDGLAEELPAEKFADLLNCFEDYHPNLIFLNACFSAHQADTLLPYTQQLIGFFYAAEPNLSMEFAKLFYYRLVTGNTIKEAFNTSKNNLIDQLPKDTDHIVLMDQL